MKQMTQIVFGMVVKEDAGGRRHGSSKTVHALRRNDDETVDPICSPRDVALPVEKYSASDVTCVRCLARRDQWADAANESAAGNG